MSATPAANGARATAPAGRGAHAATARAQADGERMELGAGAWLLWRSFVLRSAGLPFGDLSRAVAADPPPSDAGTWAQAVELGTANILELAEGDSVRIALHWQNPQIVNVVCPWLAAKSRSGQARTRNARYRLNSHTLVKYLQRYYTRNESVGCFGPVVWGAIEDDADRFTVEPGPSVAGRRKTYIEDWAADALGRAFAADPAIARQLPPAFAFGVARVGPLRLRSQAGLVRIHARHRDVIALVDGRRTAADIAACLAISCEAVEEALGPLLDDGLITRGFDVPFEMNPERSLALALDRLEPGPAVDRAKRALEQIEAARAQVARAEKPDELASALSAFDDCFTRVSHADASRTGAEVSYGRRPLVEQGERGVRMAVGRDLVGELAGPLALLLSGARWLAWRAGEQFEADAARAHRALAALYTDGAVPLDVLCAAVLPGIQQPGWLADLVREQERRWLRVLRPEPGATRIARTAARLRAAVEREFGCPAPGYAAGWHHSPDIMLAAHGPDAVAAGDFEFVLGELHVGFVSVDSRMFTDFLADPAVIRRCTDAVLPDGQPRFVPLHPRRPGSRTSGWTYPAPDGHSERQIYLSYGERVGERAVPESMRVPLSSVVVRHDGDALVAVFADEARHPLLRVLGDYIGYQLIDRFRMLPPLPHTPRVTIDRLVAARETWRIPQTRLDPLTRLPEPRAYLAARRLAAELGLPRHTFWRPDTGAKPVYLDLDSPLLVAVLVRESRKLAPDSSMVFSEMHPGPDRLWLADREGRRYTSELRLTVADATARDGAVL